VRLPPFFPSPQKALFPSPGSALSKVVPFPGEWRLLRALFFLNPCASLPSSVPRQRLLIRSLSFSCEWEAVPPSDVSIPPMFREIVAFPSFRSLKAPPFPSDGCCSVPAPFHGRGDARREFPPLQYFPFPVSMASYSSDPFSPQSFPLSLLKLPGVFQPLNVLSLLSPATRRFLPFAYHLIFLPFPATARILSTTVWGDEIFFSPNVTSPSLKKKISLLSFLPSNPFLCRGVLFPSRRWHQILRSPL